MGLPLSIVISPQPRPLVLSLTLVMLIPVLFLWALVFSPSLSMHAVDSFQCCCA